MKPLNFSQAWIRDGRKLSRSKGTSQRDVSPSDDEYPAYHRFLKTNKSLECDEPTRRSTCKAEDMGPPRRGPVRAAIKGIDTHAKDKGDLESFVKQHRHVVDSMLSSMSPRGVLSATKSASTTTASSTPRSLARLAAPLIAAPPTAATSWSSSDSDNSDSEAGWRSKTASARTRSSSRPVGPVSRSTRCTAPPCAYAAFSPRHGHGHGQSDPCLCDACTSRNLRLAAAAGAALAAGRRHGATHWHLGVDMTEDTASQSSGSSLSSNGRQQLRDIVIPDSVSGPRVSYDPSAAASWRTEHRTGAAVPPPPPPPQRPPPVQLSFRVAKPDSISCDEPPTPRMSWFSYLAPAKERTRPGASGGRSKGGCGSSMTGERATAAGCGSALTAFGGGAAGRVRRDISSTSSGGEGSKGSSPARVGNKDARSTGGGGGDVGGSRATQQHFRNRPSTTASGRAGAAAAAVRAPHRPPHGLRYVGPKAYDSDSDEESEWEERATVQQLLGGTAQWLRQKQLQQRRQQEMAGVRLSARRRARDAVMGALARSGGAGDSDCRSYGTRRSGGKSSSSSGSSSFDRAASAAAQAYGDAGASLASWMSCRTTNGKKAGMSAVVRGSSLALTAAEYLRSLRGLSRSPSRMCQYKPASGGTAGEAVKRSSRTARSTSPLAPIALVRRLRSTPGGYAAAVTETAAAAAESSGSDSPRARLLRDAAALLTEEAARRRRRSRSPAGWGHTTSAAASAVASTVKALSDRSEESFAHHLLAAAVMTSRSASAPRLGGRRRNSDWERQLQRQRLIAAGLASPSARSVGSANSPTSPGGGNGAGACAAAAASEISSVAAAAPRTGTGTGIRCGDGSKLRSWYLTDVLHTPVGSHFGEDAAPTRRSPPQGGSPGSPAWPGSPWAASPSQKLSLSRVWGPMGRGGDEDLGGRDAAGGLWSPMSAASDDVLWRSPPRPLSAPRAALYRCYPALSADQSATMAVAVRSRELQLAEEGRVPRSAHPGATARSAAAAALAATAGRAKAPPLTVRLDPGHLESGVTPCSRIPSVPVHSPDGRTDGRVGGRTGAPPPASVLR